MALDPDIWGDNFLKQDSQPKFLDRSAQGDIR